MQCSVSGVTVVLPYATVCGAGLSVLGMVGCAPDPFRYTAAVAHGAKLLRRVTGACKIL